MAAFAAMTKMETGDSTVEFGPLITRENRAVVVAAIATELIADVINADVVADQPADLAFQTEAGANLRARDAVPARSRDLRQILVFAVARADFAALGLQVSSVAPERGVSRADGKTHGGGGRA